MLESLLNHLACVGSVMGLASKQFTFYKGGEPDLCRATILATLKLPLPL
jgi:hypothetical protein